MWEISKIRCDSRFFLNLDAISNDVDDSDDSDDIEMCRTLSNFSFSKRLRILGEFFSRFHLAYCSLDTFIVRLLRVDKKTLDLLFRLSTRIKRTVSEVRTRKKFVKDSQAFWKREILDTQKIAILFLSRIDFSQYMFLYYQNWHIWRSNTHKINARFSHHLKRYKICYIVAKFLLY